jgi:periplasmic protein CpxP/Spy
MKNKGLFILLVVLLIGNIIWVYLYLTKHPAPRKGGSRMREQFMREVGFSKKQSADFDQLRNEQRATMEPQMDSMHVVKKKYIQAMFNGMQLDSLQRAYAQEVGRTVIMMDYKMHQQLIEARKICTPEQYVKYDSLVKNILLRQPGKNKNK